MHPNNPFRHIITKTYIVSAIKLLLDHGFVVSNQWAIEYETDDE